ncbi:hypothetical protein C8R45DRAFT_989656 [Mycena sanguinolenta]|nr:hypothetical protein C8R45DRAFT_989656 [Mycena sanguinolenta]
MSAPALRARACLPRLRYLRRVRRRPLSASTCLPSRSCAARCTCRQCRFLQLQTSLWSWRRTMEGRMGLARRDVRRDGRKRMEEEAEENVSTDGTRTTTRAFASSLSRGRHDPVWIHSARLTQVTIGGAGFLFPPPLGVRRCGGRAATHGRRRGGGTQSGRSWK